MKKFSFRKKGLIKSTINNHQSKSLPFEGRLGRVLFLLVVAIMTCGEVWGECYAFTRTSKIEASSGTDGRNTTYTDEMAITAAPAGTTLTYQWALASNASYDHYCTPQYYVNGQWVSCTKQTRTSKSWSDPVTETIQAGATKIRFARSASKWSAYQTLQVTNIYISQHSYLNNPSTSSLSFGNVNRGSSSSKTFTIDYSAQGSISVSSNSSDFTVSYTKPDDCAYGTLTVTVNFVPQCKGTRSGTITIKGASGSKTVNVSGTGVALTQALNWNNEASIETNMLKGTTQNISATATSGLPVSYSSTNSSILSVDATGKLTAVAVGSATITASQNGDDCTYNEATSISKTFQVKTKDTPIFTPNGFSEGTTKNLKVGDKVTLGVQYVSDGLNGDFKATNYDANVLGITRDGNTITIEAKNEGNSSVTFTQTETSAIFGASKTYSFAVTKITNTLEANVSSATLEVGASSDAVLDLSKKNSDAAITMTPQDGTLAYYDVAQNKIVAQNTNNQSFDSKTVSVTISQAATYKYTAFSKTISVTVNKKENPIAIASAKDLFVEAEWTGAMTGKVSAGGITTQSDYPAIASYDIVNNKVIAPNSGAVSFDTKDVKISITQAETFNYKGKTISTTVTVKKYEPSVTWLNEPFYFNSTYYNIYTLYEGDASLFSIASSDTEVASVSGTTMKTYNKDASTTITVTAAENYKWQHKTFPKQVTPVTANNHVQFTFNEAFLNSIPSDKKSEAHWNGWVELAENKGAKQTTGWIIIPFKGIPDKLTFDFAVKSKIYGTAPNAYIYQSSDGVNFGDPIWESHEKEKDWVAQGPVQLSPTTRYLKLYYYGYNRGQFNNLTVTELQYYRRQGSGTLNFGENQQGSAPAVQSFVVEHCNAGYQTEVIAPAQYEVSLDNNTFASSAVYSTNANHKTGGDTLGTFTVYVKYLTTEVGTHNNRNVIVRNNLRGDINVPVTGTTVTKHQPEFTNNVAATYLVDDNAIDLNTLWTSTSDATRQYVIASWTPNTSHSEGSTEPSISGTTLTLGQAGTLKLRATVAETSAYYAGKDSCIVKINKRNPTITWANGPFYFNNTYNNIYAREEGDPALFSISSSDTQVAEVEGTTMKTYNKPATTTITVSTVENYKWMSKQFEKAITPVKASNHVTFDYTKELFNNKDVTTYSSAEWPDGKAYVRIGGQENYSQKEGYVVFKLEGVPDKLLFNYSTSTTIYEVSAAPQWKIYQSTNGTTWGDPIWTSSKKSDEWEQKDINYNISQQLLPTTQYIQLYYYGFCAGDYRVTVSELEYFRRQGEATTLNFGSNQKDHIPAVQSFTVEHCNAGYQTGIKAPAHYQISLDATTGFTDSITYSTNATALTGGDKKGYFTVYVKYMADELDKTHPGNVVVSNNLRSSVLIPVTGTTVGKLSTTLHYIGATTSMMVDTGNVAASQMFEVRDANNQLVSSANITLATSDESIISLVDANTIKPICGGTATITASYAGDETTYKPATSLQQQITINRLEDEVTFPKGKSVVINGDVYTADWADAKSKTTITYETSDASIVKIEDGQIKAVGKGTATITATSEGNCTYNSGSATMNIKVRNSDDPCETLLLDKPSKVSLGYTSGTTDYTFADGPLDKMTFKVWKYTAATQEAVIKLLDANGDLLHQFEYSVDKLGTSEPSEPNRTIDLTTYPTAKKIHMYGNGTLNKYISSIKVYQQTYLTPKADAITMSTVKACETATGEVTLDYSDISRIQLSQTDTNFTYEVYKNGTLLPDGFDNDCGAYGTYVVRFSYMPKVYGAYSNTVTFSASGKSAVVTINGTANKPDRQIVWDQAAGNEIFVTQSVTLNAYAKTNCVDTAGSVYYTVEPETSATVNGNTITFTSAAKASVTVTAHTVTSDLYNDAPVVEKAWTVKKIGAVITKLPTITSTITYGDAGSSVTWSNDWTAVDSLNRKPLEGAMSYASPATFTSAGKQNVVLNFTPTDLTNYDATAVNVPVTVQKATPTITWPIASNVVYTPTLTLADVTLQNGYATFKGAVVEGTFAWKVPTTTLEAGDGQSYAVVFTPTSDNFNGDEDNVSFNVTKATPDALPEAITLTYGEKANEKTITSTSTSTVAGTWTWNDSRVSDVLNVGNYDMNVHFTPTDTKNYTEKDAQIAVTVNQATPVVTVTASDITYGQKVGESVLTNEGTPGTWAWDDEIKDQVLTAGTHNDLAVHFTPTDTKNYTTLDGTVSLTVNKAVNIVTWEGETTYEWGNINNNFTATSGTVTMTSLNESVAKIENNQIVPVNAGTVTIQGDVAESTNYLAGTQTVVITINAPATNIFTNAKGNNDWNDPDNWSSGVPAKDQEANITVKGELNINETITVGSLTIENTGKVNVIQSGKLSVKKESGESASGYGDLYVKNGGDIILDATLDVRNFVIESSIGTSDGSSKSGQITNADSLRFNDNGDAYIDINLDPSGIMDDSQWYAFAVPFQVDIATGVYRKEKDGSFKQLADKTNFDIMRYNPTKRLNSGKGWEYYHGVLNAGEIYYIGCDGTNNVYRFCKKAGTKLVASNEITLKTNGEVSNYNANWNPVGNPCLRHTSTQYSGYVQVYKNGESAYLTVPAKNVTYVVGCPFFIQAKKDSTIVMETSDATSGQFFAPRRTMMEDKSTYQVQLLQENGKLEDQIFVSASETASNTYETEADLLKAGTGTRCGQIWINAYNQILSVNEAVLENNLAEYSLSLYAPKAGEYNLHVGSNTNNGALYLTENGNIIWDLSKDDYSISLAKGTNNDYGLIFQKKMENTPTDIDEAKVGMQVEKFIYNNQMYILKNGRLYNATGAIVK